jgi:hypothetical protein
VAGLAGYGRCDEIEIEVMSPDGEDGWELQLVTPDVDLRFTIAGPAVVTDLVRFLDAAGTGDAEFELGRIDRARVFVARDERSGAPRLRFTLRAEGGFVGLHFSDDRARKLIAALLDADAELGRSSG